MMFDLNCPKCGSGKLTGNDERIWCRSCGHEGPTKEFRSGDDSIASIREKIYKQISSERERQDEKWGDQSGHDDSLWQLIFTEEVGEISEAILKADWEGGDPARIKAEVLQAAAVAVAWLEALEQRGEK